MTMTFLAPPPLPPAVVRRRQDHTAEPVRLTLPEIIAPGRTTAEAHWVVVERVQCDRVRRQRRESLAPLLDQVSTLFADGSNFDEECQPPTPRSLEACFDLLDGVVTRMALPQGTLYPDGEGGLRIEWRSGDGEATRYVLLSVHRSDERQDYIYHQQGARQGDLQTEITADLLARRLKWLTGSAK